MLLKEKQKHLSKKLFFLIFFFLFFYLASSAQAATMYFSPSSKTVNVGDIVKISVGVNTAGEAINNAEANISFPTEMLDVASINKGSVFSLWVEEPSFSNGAGTVSFNGGVPTPGYNGSGGTMLSITFRAKKAGTASIYFASGAVRANDGIGTDVLTGMGQAVLTLVEKTTTPETPDETKPPTDGTPPTKPDVSEAIDSPKMSSVYVVNSFDLNISIYNPAKVRQKYSYREYLPKELKLENIIDNGGFVIVYDEALGALLASAEFDLEAKATIKKTIRLQNVWYIADRELSEIKNKAVEYYSQLEKGQYFPQALILKNDLDLKIDQIIKLQKENANSAEGLISIYAENLLNLGIAKQDLEGLKNLLNHKEPVAGFWSYVAGIGKNASSNMILLLLINFILLLAILVHILRQHRTIKKHLGIQSASSKKLSSKPSKFIVVMKKIGTKIKHHLGGLAVALFILVLMAVGYWLVNYYKLVPKEQNLSQSNNQLTQSSNTEAVNTSNSLSLVEASELIQASSTVKLGSDNAKSQEKRYYVIVKGTPLGSLNVRSNPAKNATLVNVVHDGDKLEVSGIKANPNKDQYSWYQIIWPDNKAGWIYGQYLEELAS
jgi:hypothetical protein